MYPIFKATGFMLVSYLCHALIHVTGAHEKRFILEEIQGGYVLNFNPFWHNYSAASTSNGNNNNGQNENKLNTDRTGPTVHETPFQGCGMYEEYNDLISLKHAQECHTIDYALTTLHALHEYQHGTECIRDLIKELKVFFAQSYFSSKDCQCMGHVVYNINRTQQKANNYLFQNGSSVGPCAHHSLVWNLISAVTTNLSGSVDCQWEILKHFNGILDIPDSQCTCENVQGAVSVAPTLTTTTSILAMPSCRKNATIYSLLHRMQFHHPIASSCGSTSDHRGPDALVFNLCQTTNDTSEWKVGPNVMSNCQNIPLYTPVATFINGIYSNNGGLSGIFLGCLPDGFKLVVQECGSNSTILHLGKGGILLHDPNLYFVVTE